MSQPDSTADVIVVGNGPVGATLAILLAQRGRRVLVLERRRAPYLLPRATGFDGETARLLAATGIGAHLGAITQPADGYQWRTASGKALLDIEFTMDGVYGWPDANTMHQPALEELLAARAAELPGVTVLRGCQAVKIADRGDRVVVSAEHDGAIETYRARWVVGCDGANSFVRSHLAVPVTDLGISHEWVLCDVELHEEREFVPTNVQICDPARPTTLVASGPGRRRWEFMRLPGESSAELSHEETIWRLLALHNVTPGNATLLRTATYVSRAAWADQWRVGRVLLAGDAAHLMPPFAGQGMCSGLRDVTNLAWKLDLVLSGLCPETLLDTYTEERRENSREMVLTSVQLGRLICVTDVLAAAERDAIVLAGRRGRGPQPADPAKPLTTGVRYAAGAGEVVPQGRVKGPGGSGLFDDVVGRGFVLLLAPGQDPPRDDLLKLLGVRVVRLGDDVVDVDGVYLELLDRHGATAMLVRPDYHVFGASRDPADLLDSLRAQLQTAG